MIESNDIDILSLLFNINI